MANQAKRKYEALDVVSMYATLTEKHWRDTLETACLKGNTEALTKWRYGMQAGLADAVSHGLSNEKLEHWVIKRLRNIENAMKWILRQKHPMPGDRPIPIKAKGQRQDFIQDALSAKKARDREFQNFLMRSAF